jgi:hypothetical protein
MLTIILAVVGFIFTVFFSSVRDKWWEGFGYGAIIFSLPHFILALVDRLKITFSDIIAVALLAISVHYNGGRITLPTLPLPAPAPPPERRPLLPWRQLSAGTFLESSDGVGPEGREVTVDIPPEYRKKNIASKGLGCCVFRSTDHNAHDSQTRELYGFPEWMVSKGIEGGGYPEKFDQLVKQICKDRGVPVTKYLQHTGGEVEFLDAAMKTGRSVGVTYAGKDPRYGMNTGIDHMVSLVHLDDKYACILDNNYINAYLWMTRAEFIQRWKDRGGGWAVLLLDSPAPQAPTN